MGVQHKDWFNDIDSIVNDNLRFKAKLAIGEDAYTSLRLKNASFEVWDAAGIAVSAAGVAKSTVVASKFFAPSGLLGLIGIGAVTPVGWVVAAGVVTGGAWIGITRYLKNTSSDRVTVIPKFINTPADVLALGLFDLLAPLALKVADIDGCIDEAERDHIKNYFIKEWGYSSEFANEGIRFTESKLSDFTVSGVAQTLAEFQKGNPDCNYKSMSKEILIFLNNIMEADGMIDEREEMAIEKVQDIFEKTAKFAFKKSAKKSLSSVSNSASNLLTKFKRT